MVPFSDIPNHRRESAQKASNRGFISAAKEYQVLFLNYLLESQLPHKTVNLIF